MNSFNIRSLMILLIIAIMLILESNGQKQQVKPEITGISANDTVELVFGTTKCFGKDLLTLKIRNDTQHCNKLVQKELIERAKKGSKKGKKKTPPKLVRKNEQKCMMTCLWNLWGLTEFEKIDSKTKTFLKETFPTEVQQYIADGFETCTSLDSSESESSERKKFDNCSKHLHVTRCFKKTIQKACSGNVAKISAKNSSGAIFNNSTVKSIGIMSNSTRKINLANSSNTNQASTSRMLTGTTFRSIG